MERIVEIIKGEQGSRSQMEYADFLGINHSTLSRLYSGERNVGINLVTRIVNKLPRKCGDEIMALIKKGRDN